MNIDHELIRQAAPPLVRMGYDVTVLQGKRPALRNWLDRRMSERELDFYLARYRWNIGVVVRGLAVVDCDEPKGQAWADRHNLTSPMVCESSRGRHIYLRLPDDFTDVRTRSIPGGGGEIKMTGAVCCPPSIHPGTGWVYRWQSGVVRPEELPLFPGALLESPTNHVLLARNMVGATVDRTVARVRKYVRCIVARNHSGAHNSAYRCACKIADVIKDFDLAMQVYREWNASNAVDEDGSLFPFSEGELQHKMQDAFRRPSHI